VIFWLFGENGNFFAKAKKALISLVFRTPTRFLIQIFLIGPEKHYSLWKYLISRHYCSLLLITAHFSSFSAFPGVRKKRGKLLKMSSSEQ